MAIALEEASANAGGQLASFAATGAPQHTRSGLAVVHLRQQYAGIPVRDGVRSVRFDPDGAVIAFTGRSIPVTRGTPTVPRLSARSAAQAACLHVAKKVSRRRIGVPARPPRMLAEFNLPSRPAALAQLPFQDAILASLTVMSGRGRRSELAWEVRLRLPGAGTAYSVLVSATDRRRPRVLGTDRLSAHAVSYEVYDYDPRDDERVRRGWPVDRTFYPRFADASIPKPAWVAAQATSGNNVVCEDSDGSLYSCVVNGADLLFGPPDPVGPDHWRVNAFFLCNLMHDFFLLLGFDEKTGNFQKQNDPGVGAANDALRVVVWKSKIQRLAYFLNRPDGNAPELNLGPLDGRHSALDADVVIHEYVHGVTSRVIGGPGVDNPLRQPQSRALGEGYSDYYAISFQNHLRRRANQPLEWVFGAWIADKTTGLRNFAYDDTFRGTYGNLGKDNFKEDQDAGQVWCKALLDVSQALALGADADTADEQAWQLVFDSMRLLHPGENGPTFLHARDALMTEFDAAVRQNRIPADAALRRRVWDCFERRRMGTGAESADAGYKRIKESA